MRVCVCAREYALVRACARARERESAAARACAHVCVFEVHVRAYLCVCVRARVRVSVCCVVSRQAMERRGWSRIFDHLTISMVKHEPPPPPPLFRGGVHDWGGCFLSREDKEKGGGARM